MIVGNAVITSRANPIMFRKTFAMPSSCACATSQMRDVSTKKNGITTPRPSDGRMSRILKQTFPGFSAIALYCLANTEISVQERSLLRIALPLNVCVSMKIVSGFDGASIRNPSSYMRCNQQSHLSISRRTLTNTLIHSG